ncbi:MFS transporter [Sphingomonas sp. AOB5]|uniref:MFS transporter n=1 Tax=Sphingomonas sp. AOB5 TaxID=3034017 RepID=UPI0023F726D7|nr:MFS transporter [Sphingomonas sp. AOB5]MDF7777640.1 MFS transporter [Sphingomonas sp. AOB5]
MAPTKAKPTFVRHYVLWLTVLAYMITYMDRVVISTAAPSIQEEFGFSEITMGWIFGIFQLGYALFQIPGGWLGDRFGPRRALTGIVVWWSAFTAFTAMTWSAGSMLVCRFLFGMGEAGAFPIATRSLSRWMLPSERGWAQGVTHAGARLGAAITPVAVVYLILHFGWRAPFFIFALVGLLWAAFWFWFYRDRPAEHDMVNDAERTMIAEALGTVATSTQKVAVPWGRLLSSPLMWTLAAMYFCYAYSIGLFLTWFPKYLHTARSFELAEMGLYASMPLMAGVLGDIAGGWISDHYFKRSGNLKMARRLVAMVGFLLAAITIPLAVMSDSPLVSVGWFCLAVFGLELTVGVSWAVTLDIGGNYAGSVSAVMNTFGNIGGAIASFATGYIVTYAGYDTAFYLPSALCLIAALLFLKIDASKRLYGEEPKRA